MVDVCTCVEETGQLVRPSLWGKNFTFPNSRGKTQFLELIGTAVEVNVVFKLADREREKTV